MKIGFCLIELPHPKVVTFQNILFFIAYIGFDFYNSNENRDSQILSLAKKQPGLTTPQQPNRTEESSFPAKPLNGSASQNLGNPIKDEEQPKKRNPIPKNPPFGNPRNDPPEIENPPIPKDKSRNNEEDKPRVPDGKLPLDEPSLGTTDDEKPKELEDKESDTKFQVWYDLNEFLHELDEILDEEVSQTRIEKRTEWLARFEKRFDNKTHEFWFIIEDYIKIDQGTYKLTHSPLLKGDDSKIDINAPSSISHEHAVFFAQPESTIIKITDARARKIQTGTSKLRVSGKVEILYDTNWQSVQRKGKYSPVLDFQFRELRCVFAIRRPS